MQPIPKEQIIKRIQLLPEILQEAFFSDRTVSAILKNCALRDIPPTNTYFVGVLARRVLLGYLRPENFISEIQKETGVSEMTAQLIAHDIDGEIFSNVRLELKKLYPPVIQTPTVQSWKQESRIMNQELRKADEMPAKPKYVIPIPEKFMKRETWSVKPETQNQDLRIEESAIQKQTQPTIQNTETQNQKQADQYSEVRPPTINNLPPHQPQKTTNNAVMGGIQMAEIEPQKPAVGGLTPVKPPQQIQTPQTTSMPPLPLKANEAKPTNEAIFKPIVPLPTFIRSQFKMEEPKAKDFVGKFGAPDPTLAKPTPSKEDQYREKV